MRRKQRGVTLVVVTIALFSLILVGGLALDIGRVMVNKARLQAAVDAAALSAAKVLDVTGSTTQATTAVTNVFTLNARHQSDLWSVFGNVTRTVEYSNALPFVAGTTPANYVRVTASGFSIAATLATVAGINNFTIAAKAVAGPSPTINTACNLAPIVMCGTPGAPPLYGYTAGEIMVLKQAGGGSSPIGPGNYGLMNVGSGASAVRTALAGGFSACATIGNGVQSEPGVAAGPTAQGINTRFNEYSGPMNGTSSTYPPDVITNQPSGNSRLSCTDNSCTAVQTGSGSSTQIITNANQYSGWSYEGMYQPALANQSYDVPPPTGVPDRRILAVPIGDCSAGSGGSTPLNVLGLACVFLLQDVNQSDSNIFGEVLSSCQVDGNPGPAPSSGPGPYIIQLYHVDGSPES